MNSLNIFDLLILGSGIYLVYAAIAMKTKGKILGGVVVSKDVDVEHMKDKQGFITAMFPKSLLLGILTCVLGVFGILNSRYGGMVYIQIGAIVVYLILLIVYAALANKAQKKYI